MAWKDRIQAAVYISPSGLRFDFLYENVSMSADKKTGEFDFPDIDGIYVQDLGVSGRKFPFIIFFSGDDYDIIADSFFQALEERGIGTLEHPVYKTRKVVPTGTITRRDDLVTAANQAAFNVTFTETIEDINFPSSQISQENIIQSDLDNLNVNTSSNYSGNIFSQTETQNAVLQNDLLDKKNIIEKALDDLKQLNEDIENAFDQVSESFDNNLINLFTDPEGISDQFITLINTPANVISSGVSFIQGYGNAISTIIDGIVDTPGKFFNSLLSIASLFGALNFSMTNSEFTNRPEALNAINDIIEVKENIDLYIDDKNNELEISDTGEIYDSLNQLFNSTISFLIDLSFDLPKEIFITLDSDRNIVELTSELYGDLEKLDFLITTNNLNYDELEILPTGKRIVYYE